MRPHLLQHRERVTHAVRPLVEPARRGCGDRDLEPTHRGLEAGPPHAHGLDRVGVLPGGSHGNVETAVPRHGGLLVPPGRCGAGPT